MVIFPETGFLCSAQANNEKESRSKLLERKFHGKGKNISQTSKFSETIPDEQYYRTRA